MTVEKTHVVVTRYLPAEKPPLVHAYGPMTHARAKTVREELLAQHADKVTDGTFSAGVNKMLDIDERNESPKIVKKPLGMLALEGFMDAALTGARDGIGIYEAMTVIEDLTERAICDLGDSGRKGMNLLVRLAMAAREWDKATDGLGSLFETGPAATLRRTVAELDQWEKSL